VNAPLLPAAGRRALTAWFEAKRRDLPWRADAGERRDPYEVWVSEIMLQQTRVETVVPYFTRFMDRFPTVRALAAAPRGAVLSAWSGLGYYRRARLLHDGARHVETEHHGRVPEDAAAVARIPGVGPYTAGAILSLAFGRPAALVDGNVARVFSRWFVLSGDPAVATGKARVWRIARRHVEAEADPGRWNEALMELGATVCTPRAPRCSACPVASRCEAHARSVEERYPRASRRGAVPTERLHALVARRRGRVLLGRRAEASRFGGMWEPPVVRAAGHGLPGAARDLSSVVGSAIIALEVAGDVTHVLTHRRLAVRVFRGSVAGTLPGARDPYEKWTWADARALADMGLSTFARKLIERAG
jgi:A/G-specific adenine glycosylase